MEVKILSKEEIDIEVSNEIRKAINENPSLVLGLATGSTPVGIYKRLIDLYESGLVSFKNVQTFNLDEYIDLKDSTKSYRYFMDNNLFNHVDIKKENTHMPVDENYDNEIFKSGGIDLQILGIGSDGHIAFNEPGTSLDSTTHIAKLSLKTREDNSRFFDSINDVPETAITMGLKSIMNSKKIILIAIGKNKAKAVNDMICGPINELCPASILRSHKNVIIYLDKDAASY